MAIKIDAQLGRLPGQVRSRTIASLRKEGPDPLAMPGSNYLGIAEKYDKNISEEVKNVIVAYDTAKINRDVAKQNMLLKRSKYLVDQLVGKNLGKIQLEIERKVSLKTLAEGTITKEELLKKFRDSNIKGLDAFDPSVSGDARIHYYLHQGSYEAALEAYYDTHVIQDFQQDVVKEITEYHDAVSNGKLPFYPNKDNKVLSEDAKRFVNEYRMKSSEFVDTMTALEMDEIELGNKIIKREDLEKHLLAKHFISSNRDKYITDQGYVKYSEMAKTELNKEYGEEEKKYIKAELAELTKIQTEEVQNSNSELTMGLIDAYKSKDANKKNEAWESFIANYIHLPGTNQQQTTKALKGLGDFITKGFTDKALTTDQEIIQRDVKEQFYKGNITVHNVYKAEGEDDSQAKSILERFIEGSIDESFFLAAVTYQQTDDKKNILTSLEDKVENQFAPEFENLITGKGGDYEYLYSQNSLSQLRKLAYVKNIVHDTIMDLILDANVDPIQAEEIIKEQLNLGNPDSILNKIIDKWAATSDNMDFSFKEMLGKEDRGKKPFIRQNREIKIKKGDGAVVDVTPELLLQLKEMYLKKDPIEQFKMEKELQKRTGEENILELMGIDSEPTSFKPAKGIIEQVSRIVDKEGWKGLFEYPNLIEPPPGEDATDDERAEYLVNLVMGSIAPGGPIKINMKALNKIVSKMWGKAKDAKATAIAYEGFRRKGNRIGANVEAMADFTSIIKNPTKVLNENQVLDYLELAGVRLERDSVSGVFNVDLVKTSINKAGKLVVKITTEAKKIITITEPTLQKLIDKGFKLD